MINHANFVLFAINHDPQCILISIGLSQLSMLSLCISLSLSLIHLLDVNKKEVIGHCPCMNRMFA
jgi:hypothetical protein